jgi:hypothetical protein
MRDGMASSTELSWPTSMRFGSSGFYGLWPSRLASLESFFASFFEKSVSITDWGMRCWDSSFFFEEINPFFW